MKRSRQSTLLAFFPKKVQKNTDLPPLPLTLYCAELHYKKAQKTFKENFKGKYENYKCLNGYLFAASDEFTCFYVYSLIDREDTNHHCVWLAGKWVATAELDDDSALIQIEVMSEFRRQKIGSELIRFINERSPQFHVYGGQEYNSRYRLTEDGMELMQYCVRNNILPHEKFIGNEIPCSPEDNFSKVKNTF